MTNLCKIIGKSINLFAETRPRRTKVFFVECASKIIAKFKWILVKIKKISKKLKRDPSGIRVNNNIDYQHRWFRTIYQFFSEQLCIDNTVQTCPLPINKSKSIKLGMLGSTKNCLTNN